MFRKIIWLLDFRKSIFECKDPCDFLSKCLKCKYKLKQVTVENENMLHPIKKMLSLKIGFEVSKSLNSTFFAKWHYMF